MDLDLDDDQQLLVESFRALLDKQSSAERVRAAEPLGFDPGLWRALLDVGSIQMAVDEESGGWGASMLDLCLVAEEIGRHCAPAPVIEAQVAARLLARLGAAELDTTLTGATVATVALHDPVDGAAQLTPAGAVADLVVFRDGQQVRAAANADRPPAVPNLADLPLADVPTAGAAVLAQGPAAIEAFETAVDEWLLLTASALVGIAASSLAIAVEYAKERHAFGVPIGSFQGIAHRLADIATDLDGGRLLVHEAAWSVDGDHPEASERACGAFGFAADAAHRATHWAVHTLGGYGVMVEYDTQLLFRRARGWSGVFGDPDAAYLRTAAHRYRRTEA